MGIIFRQDEQDCQDFYPVYPANPALFAVFAPQFIKADKSAATFAKPTCVGYPAPRRQDFAAALAVNLFA